MIWRILPLIGVLLFLSVGLAGRAWFQVRRYGSSGIMLFRAGRRRQHIRDGLFVLLLLLVMGQALIAAIVPGTLFPLGTVLPPARAAALRPVGAVLLFGGLALMLIAQLDLGGSWRIGIEEQARPGLVTTGMYRVCRNPIFLFMFVMFVGYTVLLPSWLSVVLLVGAFLGNRQQVIVEEAYLLRAYGDEYRAYARRVGRFLPWVGRLP